MIFFIFCIDCTALYKKGERASGVYTIRPDGSPAFPVYCDLTDGGWTVFMRRFNGSQDFFLFWKQYKEGFGNVTGEYWLGNDKLHLLTNQNQYNMRMDATVWSTGVKKYATYETFRVENEGSKYRLQVYKPTGHDSMNLWYKGRPQAVSQMTLKIKRV